eukprot:6179704-Pleurochrysis_carterae.AAC.1
MMRLKACACALKAGLGNAVDTKSTRPNAKALSFEQSGRRGDEIPRVSRMLSHVSARDWLQLVLGLTRDIGRSLGKRNVPADALLRFFDNVERAYKAYQGSCGCFGQAKHNALGCTVASVFFAFPIVPARSSLTRNQSRARLQEHA